MKKLKYSVYGWLYLLLILTFPLPTSAASEPSVFPSDTETDACFNPLKLEHTRLKDHTLFFYDNFYYIASIHLPRSEGQFKDRHFVYARTRDFCTWEDLGIILEPGPKGAPDEGGIWAPYVIREGDTFFMFYTGFNRNVAQSIMLATSTNPADPKSWMRRGLVFNLIMKMLSTAERKPGLMGAIRWCCATMTATSSTIPAVTSMAGSLGWRLPTT